MLIDWPHGKNQILKRIQTNVQVSENVFPSLLIHFLFFLHICNVSDHQTNSNTKQTDTKCSF